MACLEHMRLLTTGENQPVIPLTASNETSDKAPQW